MIIDLLSNLSALSSTQGYIKGKRGNNLSSQQQQQFDNAIRDGNMSTAMHFEMIARSNAARDQFARENKSLIKAAQRGDETAISELKMKVRDKDYNGITIGVSSVDSIIKYGGSVVSAVDDGRAEAGGTFKSAKVVSGGVAGDKGSLPTSYSEPSKSTTTSTSIKPKPEPQPSSGAGDSAAAQNAIAAAAARRRQELADAASAKAAREKIAQAAAERSRRNREQSISRTPPKTTPKPKPTRTDRFGRSRSVSRAQQMAVQGIKKGGLMEKDK